MLINLLWSADMWYEQYGSEQYVTLLRRLSLHVWTGEMPRIEGYMQTATTLMLAPQQRLPDTLRYVR